MDKKSISIRIDKTIFDKVHYIADFEARTINSLIKVLIRDCIKDYEEKYGEIKTEN